MKLYPIEYIISSLIRFSESFKTGEKDIEAPHNSSDIDKLNKLIQTHPPKGVCRHKAAVFIALSDALGIPSRKITNDCHAFVETQGKDTWFSQDLGGAEANLVLLPMSEKKVAVPKNPEDTKEKEAPSARRSDKEEKDENKIDEIKPKEPSPITNSIIEPAPPSPDNPFLKVKKSSAKTWKKFCQEIIKLDKPPRNISVLMQSQQMEFFYRTLLKHHPTPENCIYVNNLDNLNEKQMGLMDSSGSVSNDTRLPPFIKIPKKGIPIREQSSLANFVENAKSNEILISNWTEYESHHVGLNAMMDDERLLKKTKIAPALTNIVLLDKAEANSRNNDFFSRLTTIVECPDLPPEKKPRRHS